MVVDQSFGRLANQMVVPVRLPASVFLCAASVLLTAQWLRCQQESECFGPPGCRLRLAAGQLDLI